MIRVLPTFAAALVACTASPQETAMHSQDPATIRNSATGAGDQERAALGPSPEQVSAAENPVPAPPADSPAEAQGRRTLSTAFVRIGPDGHLTVELRNGRLLVLRDVTMNRKDYCGVQALSSRARARYCGGYAEIAAARPGGGPVPEAPDLAVPNPVKSPDGASKGD